MNISALLKNLREIYPPKTVPHLEWVAEMAVAAGGMLAYIERHCPEIKETQTYKDFKSAVGGDAYDWYTGEWDRYSLVEIESLEDEYRELTERVEDFYAA